jgi:uncharacterized peroxidase-related enzyme
MAWIKMIKEDEAHDYLRTLYKKYGDPFEGVPNILKIQSLNPSAMRFHYDYRKHILTEKSGLSRMQREMIGILVSSLCQCEYTLKHSERSMDQLTKNPALIEGIKSDFRKLNIGDNDIGMLEYVEKLTTCPNEVGKKDVDRLRELGFKDHDILDIAQAAAYFIFTTRMVQGLGVELEPYWDED